VANASYAANGGDTEAPTSTSQIKLIGESKACINALRLVNWSSLNTEEQLSNLEDIIWHPNCNELERIFDEGLACFGATNEAIVYSVFAVAGLVVGAITAVVICKVKQCRNGGDNRGEKLADILMGDEGISLSGSGNQDGQPTIVERGCKIGDRPQIATVKPSSDAIIASTLGHSLI
jgi:hypothetical protein